MGVLELFRQSTTYSYNALGQRVNKSNSSSTTRFFYDESGRLIAEYLVAENKWKEYIYLHGQVVGFAVNGALYYVHNDHLGRAERITNASKSTVWRANNYDFDRVVAYGSADWYNLGFPGQYYDSEKDSYYNYFRDYDPKTGRYIQSDPIGLAGGINTYGYVSANPVSYVDPFGLTEWNGTFFQADAGFGGFMGSSALATFTSDCDKEGYQVTATILFSGYGFGGGLSWMGASGSKISVKDDSDLALVQNLEGSAILTTLSISPGFGGSYFDLNFGNVRTTGFSTVGGVDVGGSVIFGKAELINNSSYPYSRKKCDCEAK